jgi:hypothetical protein
MDWFESLTGFRETAYEDTRAKLKVEGGRLRSVVNGKRLKVRVVRGDVRHMHQAPENAGALFQVASQFNLLEMVSPTVTPEDGVTRYQKRHPP